MFNLRTLIWQLLMYFQTPYLHWDTDYGRRQLNSSIRTTIEAANLASPNTATGVSKTSLHPNPQRQRENRLSISTIVDEALECSTPMGNIRPSGVRVPHEPPATRGSILFHILMHAAQLYEMVTFYEDQHLVKGYLLGNPPLHPRRTLHQYFNAYSFLKSTDILDKGQVVCKATAPLKQAPRHHCSRTYRCQTCMRDIRPVPKILMIDQLWLFILNGGKLNSVLRFSVTPNSPQTLSSPVSLKDGGPCTRRTLPE